MEHQYHRLNVTLRSGKYYCLIDLSIAAAIELSVKFISITDTFLTQLWFDAYIRVGVNRVHLFLLTVGLSQRQCYVPT
jgi:hypothetical protein